jgi:hypothetical protein
VGVWEEQQAPQEGACNEPPVARFIVLMLFFLMESGCIDVPGHICAALERNPPRRSNSHLGLRPATHNQAHISFLRVVCMEPISAATKI